VAIPLQIYIRERETALGPRGSETRVKLNPKRKNNNFYHLAKKTNSITASGSFLRISHFGKT